MLGGVASAGVAVWLALKNRRRVRVHWSPALCTIDPGTEAEITQLRSGHPAIAPWDIELTHVGKGVAYNVAIELDGRPVEIVSDDGRALRPRTPLRKAVMAGTRLRATAPRGTGPGPEHEIRVEWTESTRPGHRLTTTFLLVRNGSEPLPPEADPG
ncbi:hypothetical protein D7U36_02235 [Propionibacterium australiense]|nr:hypothetical protein D7U36_02235 [Propionibacterium australiense]